jgi:hypothetical protein
MGFKKQILNLWLDLDYQLEEEDIYKKIVTYIHQIYSYGLLNGLK